jgi:hypothetical protein
MAKISEAFVDITARTDKLKRGLAGAVSAAKLAAAAVAAAFAARAVARKISEATQAFIKQDDAIKRLDATMRIFGGSSRQTVNFFREQAAAIQKVTTSSDEALLGMFATAKQLGVQTDRIVDVTKAAIGLAAGLGISEKAMLRYVALAQKGDTTMLRRYLPALRSMTDQQEQLNFVMQDGAKAFEVVQEQTDSLGGRIKRMRNASSDAKESVGALFGEFFDASGILPTMTRSFEVIGGSFDALAAIGREAGRAMHDALVGPGSIAEGADGVSTAFEDMEFVVRLTLRSMEKAISFWRLKVQAAFTGATADVLGYLSAQASGPRAGLLNNKYVRNVAAVARILETIAKIEGAGGAGITSLDFDEIARDIGGRRGRAPSRDGRSLGESIGRALGATVGTVLGPFKVGFAPAIQEIKKDTDKIGDDTQAMVRLQEQQLLSLRRIETGGVTGAFT